MSEQPCKHLCDIEWYMEGHNQFNRCTGCGNPVGVIDLVDYISMPNRLAAAEQRVGELEDAIKQISIMYNDTNYQTMGELTEGMRATARAALNRLEE